MSSRRPKGRGSRRAASAPATPTPPATPAPGTAEPAEPAAAPPTTPTQSAPSDDAFTLASPSLQSLADEVAARTEQATLERTLPPAADVRPRPPAGWLAAAGCAWLLVFFALLRPPAMLEGPRAVAYQPPATLEEASDRFALWLASGRIERFIARNGRLPSFLGETGFDDARVQYTVTGERSWTLEIVGAADRLRLASGEDRAALLGDALDRLQQDG